MLTVTPPVTLAPDQVWVFVTGDTDAVDAARLAHLPGSDCFIALSGDVFAVDGTLPTYPTGDLVAGFRWATAQDIAAHADLFDHTKGVADNG